jgi:hypothetical protein
MERRRGLASHGAVTNAHGRRVAKGMADSKWQMAEATKPHLVPSEPKGPKPLQQLDLFPEQVREVPAAAADPITSFGKWVAV